MTRRPPASSPGRRVRVLSIHGDYACRHSGACCASGWDVSVEPAVEDRLRAALRDGTLRVPDGTDALLRAVPGLPHGARVVFGHDAQGRCVFLEAGHRCAVHRQLGLDHLASACRDFPRVVTLSPVGVSITLSHYCPTAASLLFREDVPLAIRDAPAAFPSSWPYEGLDARAALPPLLPPVVDPAWPGFAECLQAWRDAAAAIPTPDLVPSLPEGLAEADGRWVRPEWPGLAPPVRRYLAARAFASWCALQGQGLRTTVHAVRSALLVLRVEAARVCARVGGALDAERLREAIRATDLLLVHLASPDGLARRWAGVEVEATPAAP